MTKLSQAVDARIRIEWPGTQITRGGEAFVAPQIRVGGATDALIVKICQIIDDEMEHKF